jgi:hypothetical protein
MIRLCMLSMFVVAMAGCGSDSTTNPTNKQRISVGGTQSTSSTQAIVSSANPNNK